MGTKKGREKAFRTPPVHFEIVRTSDGLKAAKCAALTVSLTPRRNDVTCRACFTAMGVS